MAGDVLSLESDPHPGEPMLELEDSDAVLHRLWRVTDTRVVEQLVAAFRDTRAVIADGHHRFAAAQAPGRP